MSTASSRLFEARESLTTCVSRIRDFAAVIFLAFLPSRTGNDNNRIGALSHADRVRALDNLFSD